MEEKRFLNAVFKNNIPVVKEFIELGYNGINKKDRNGQTPLMIAVIEAHPEVVKLLLEHGADINETDNDNETAFDIAKQHRLEEYTGDLLYLRVHSEEIIDLLEKAEKEKKVREKLAYMIMINKDRSSFSRFRHSLFGDTPSEQTEMVRQLFDQAPPDVLLEIIKFGGKRRNTKKRQSKKRKTRTRLKRR
jgi:hypothetical protein